MKELNVKQLAEVSGGRGCICQPGPKFVALSDAHCAARCCGDAGSKSYCTFQDGATPMHKVDLKYLKRVPHHCYVCPSTASRLGAISFASSSL